MKVPAYQFDLTGSAAAGTVLVLGMGSTGASCARYLATRGVHGIFADSRRDPPGTAAIRTAMPGARLLPPGLPEALPAEVGRIVVSPGVRLDLPLLDAARSRGVEIVSDIDLFVREARAPLIAITGSNGKSTVTSMVGQMLAGAGWRVAVGGNLGTPALDLLDSQARAYVLELSSFQLERSAPLRAAAAVVLNISPDHLDTHGEMAAYVAAKARVYAGCKVAVVNRDESGTARLAGEGAPRIGFGLGRPAEGDFGLRVSPEGLWLARGWEPLMRVSDLQVTGRHNHANALAALALGTAVGAPPAALLAGLRAFRPLPHRMTPVAVHAGITWIDDSKATNVGAAAASITSTDTPLVLIAGGDGKGAAFEAVAAALRGRECVALLMGRDRQALATALAGVCTVRQVADMPAAVRAAAEFARPGWTVLLAPACSSLDMFRDYGERGDVFRREVLALTGEEAS